MKLDEEILDYFHEKNKENDVIDKDMKEALE